MADFKLGTLLRAKKDNNPYTITNEHAIVRVIGINDPNRIWVEVVAHEENDYHIGHKYNVEKEFFDPVRKRQFINK